MLPVAVAAGVLGPEAFANYQRGKLSARCDAQHRIGFVDPAGATLPFAEVWIQRRADLIKCVWRVRNTHARIVSASKTGVPQ